MIPRVHKRGKRTIGLLYYLYGPGTHEEHVDPHLVAAWDSLAPDPGRDPQTTYTDLQQLLDQPVQALAPGRRPAKHVWHLSVRAAPEDPVLSDEQWGEIARRMVAATGIAPDGDDAGCRWAAVRHADDHIHIIATLVREDGRRPRLNNDAGRAQAEARLIEAEYGLKRLNTGDGTAAQQPTSAERHKAERRQRERTPREELRETVRRAVAGATGETEFFDRLAAAGLLIRRRIAPSGDLLGYTVALPDDRNKDGEPIFYSGSKLAPDLSLPHIRERWSADRDNHATGSPNSPSQTAPGAPSAARRVTASTAWQALIVIEQGDDAVAAAHIASAGEVLARSRKPLPRTPGRNCGRPPSPSSGRPVRTCRPSADTTGHCGRPPATLSTVGPRSAAGRTGRPLRWRSTCCSSSSPPPCTGTRRRGTPSRPPPPDRRPSICAPPTGPPQPSRSAPSTSAAGAWTARCSNDR